MPYEKIIKKTADDTYLKEYPYLQQPQWVANPALAHVFTDEETLENVIDDLGGAPDYVGQNPPPR